ncbi:MAG: hypothetical protein IJ189_09125, partial [Clostridia bacterium]|nr:hypothetical protein [Clostridia bacterium]
MTDTEPLQMLSDPYTAPIPEQFNVALEENSRRNEERQATREQLEEERGLLITWTFEQQAEQFPGIYGIPDTSDISADEAYKIARKAYQDATGISEHELE